MRAYTITFDDTPQVELLIAFLQTLNFVKVIEPVKNQAMDQFRQEWYDFAAQNFEAGFEDEPEWSADRIIEHNRNYTL